MTIPKHSTPAPLLPLSILLLASILLTASLLALSPRHHPAPHLHYPLPHSAGTYTETNFPSPDPTHPAWLARTIHLYPHRYTLALLDHTTPNTATDWLDAALITHHPIAIINAGYFDPHLRPLGLRISASHQSSPPLHQPPLSALLWTDANDLPQISWLPDLPTNPTFALQAGPLLIEPDSLIGIHPPAGSPAPRTIVATTPTDLLLITTTPVSLYHLAQALANHPTSFDAPQITRALNLDGGPSTCMFLPPNVRISPTGPLREAILVLPQDAP